MSTLKVGDEVQLVTDTDGFKKGQVVEVFKLENDGQHLFKGANTEYKHCDGQEGAWLRPSYYKVLPNTTAHPHADLMLKYAMIAQYDDKPWECFEYQAFGKWVDKDELSSFRSEAQYRLKPQPPVVRVGQTWVSSGNNTEVTVLCPDVRSVHKGRFVKLLTVLDASINLKTTLVISYSEFLSNFKRKG